MGSNARVTDYYIIMSFSIEENIIKIITLNIIDYIQKNIIDYIQKNIIDYIQSIDKHEYRVT
jgi:hypothetical protein